MSYCSSAEVFNYLGKDAKTKIRGEIVGTGAGVTSSWSLDHDNIISGSDVLYTGGTIVPTSSYTINLDDGNVSGLSVPSGSVLSADYDYADIPDSLTRQMISSSDSLLEAETGRTFGTSSNTEYLGVEEGKRNFFLNNYPVLTLSSVSRNIAPQTEAPDWETLTEGLGNDYIANSEDLRIGRIRFIDNFPYLGQDMLMITYSSGYLTTPNIVKELSILLTIRQMANSAVYKSIFEGNDNFTPVRLNEISERIEELKRLLKKQNIEPI